MPLSVMNDSGLRNSNFILSLPCALVEIEFMLSKFSAMLIFFEVCPDTYQVNDFI